MANSKRDENKDEKSHASLADSYKLLASFNVLSLFVYFEMGISKTNVSQFTTDNNKANENDEMFNIDFDLFFAFIEWQMDVGHPRSILYNRL